MKMNKKQSKEYSLKVIALSFFILMIIIVISCVQDETVNPNNELIESCGFEISSNDVLALKKSNSKLNTYKRVSGIKDVPVNLTIVRQDDGSGGVSDEDITEQFNILNEIYSAAGMRFVICKTNIVNDTSLYDGSSSDQAELRNTYCIKNVVNIYVPNNVYIGSTAYCGFAYYPNGPESVYLAASCFKNGSTLSHEIGHHFGLIHTHSNSNIRGATLELSDGSNGATTGDYIQDTPSDPMLSGYVSSYSCDYYGSFLDNNGQPHQPDPKNLMSYSTKSCRYFFSQGQLDKLNSVVNGNSNRGNLQCDNTPPLGTVNNPFIVDDLTKNTLLKSGDCDTETETVYYATDTDIDLNGFKLTLEGNVKLTVNGDIKGGELSRLVSRQCAEVCVSGVVDVRTRSVQGGTINAECGNPIGSINNPKIIKPNFNRNRASRNGNCNKETIKYFKKYGDLNIGEFDFTVSGKAILTVDGNVNGNGTLKATKCGTIIVNGTINVETLEESGGSIE